MLVIQKPVFGGEASTGMIAPTAASGVTAVSGLVVDQSGNGLPNVRVVDNAESTYTDAVGRFLLQYVPPGRSVLLLDGRHAGFARDEDFGTYELPVRAKVGTTTALKFKSWLVQVDHAHEVTFPSPTVQETVVQTPLVPGLQLIIAPGVIVRDLSGHVVTKISITPVPGNKLPFPLPDGFNVPQSFAIQPGGACLYSVDGGVGIAHIRYPNIHHQMPRARENLLRFEPDVNGWTSYGFGTVSDDLTQVVPAQSAYITDFGSAECDPLTRSHFRENRRIPVSGTSG